MTPSLIFSQLTGCDMTYLKWVYAPKAFVSERYTFRCSEGIISKADICGGDPSAGQGLNVTSIDW